MKVAACVGSGVEEATASVERMAASMARGADPEHEIHRRSGGAISATFTTASPVERRLVRRSPSGNLLLVAGVPIFPGADLEAHLDGVLELGHAEAGCALAQLEGVFAALYWDAAAARLVIVTDILGMQPLYMARSEGALLVASDIRGIAASGRIELAMNPAAWGAFFIYGYALEDDTSLRGVQRVPAGQVLVFDAASQSLEATPHWRWPEAGSVATVADVDTGGLVEVLEGECAAYLEMGPPGTLLLSGGADSRLIAGLLKRLGARPEAVIVRHEDESFGADGRWGRHIAEICGLAHRLESTDRSFYSSQAYLDYLLAGEVPTRSLHLFIANVASFVTPELGAVWEGNLLGHSLKANRADTLEETLAHDGTSRWRQVEGVFSPDVARACREEFHDRTIALRKQYANDGHGVMEYVNRNYKRNRTGPNAYKVYAERVPCLTPGSTRDYWAMTAALPHSVRCGHELYRTIFDRHFPELSALPFITSGKIIHSVSKPPVAERLDRYVHAASRRIRKLRPYFRPSELVAPVVASVDPDHPDLSADGVRAIQARLRRNPTKHPSEAELLFYWQIWRWIVEGSTDRLDSRRLRSERP